jgi:prophage antirepressor-like protein
MAENKKFVVEGDLPTCRFFTERGIYTALMKSNKPIAEEF